MKQSPQTAVARRPLWSVMIPTYNCASLLETALRSVLAQDPGRGAMQIEVVDDCSNTDDPKAVVDRIGNGRVGFYQKEKNEGVARVFNTCVRRAQGSLVHILHGDDWVQPDFYQTIYQASVTYETVGLLFCRSQFRLHDGTLSAMSPRIETAEKVTHCLGEQWYTNHMYCPSVVVRREAYDSVGRFDEAFQHVGDWDMWDRVTHKCGAIHINEALANYRLSPQNDTSRLAKTAMNLRDYLKLAKVFASRHSEFSETRFLEMVADRALCQAKHFALSGDRAAFQANTAVLHEVVRKLPKRRRLVRSLDAFQDALGKCLTFPQRQLRPFMGKVFRV